jgi:TonB family protein
LAFFGTIAEEGAVTRWSVSLFLIFRASIVAMTRLFLPLSLALFAVSPSPAGDDLEKKANHIIERVSQLETFNRGDPKHKREVRFRLVRAGSPDAEGLFVVKTDSLTRWREDIDFDNYHSSEIRIKDHVWFKSTHDFLPLVVQELRVALIIPVLRMGKENSVKRVYEREIEGVRVQCIEFETVHGDNKFENEVCVQKDTGYLMWAHHDGTQMGFSEFLPIGGIVLPRQITIDLNGEGKIIAELSEEIVQKFDSTEFTPPDGAEMTEVCVTGSNPAPRYTPDPVSGLIASLGVSHGRVTGVLKVDAEGNAVNAAIVQSLGPVLDELALATVKRWKYAPATCNGRPVKAVTQFSVTY